VACLHGARSRPVPWEVAEKLADPEIFVKTYVSPDVSRPFIGRNREPRYGLSRELRQISEPENS
jgi:hypothetical protein